MLMNPGPIASAALEYARRGWPVFPLHGPGDGPTGCTCNKPDCGSPGKHPRTPRGFKDATTDLAQVEAWWRKWPVANIGIATGERAGFWVLDVDGTMGEASLAKLEAEHGTLPATLVANTGGGGRHILFAHPEGWTATISAGQLGEGLDTRATGGYIVAAPSRHAQTGALYEWAGDLDTTAIAPAPDWLPALMAQQKAKDVPRRAPLSAADAESERARKYGLAAMQQLEREVIEAAEGTRNATLNRASFRAGQLSVACGISEGMAEAMLVGAAMRAGLPESEARRTFASGWPDGLRSPAGPPAASEPPRGERAARADGTAEPAPSGKPAGDDEEAEMTERVQAIEARLRMAQGDDERKELAQLLRQAQANLAGLRALSAYGLDVRKAPYVIDARGVVHQLGKKSEVIASRPIWPAALGLDLATGDEWVQLAWETSRHRQVSEWHPCTIIADVGAVKELLKKDAPVTLGRLRGLSNWLGDACALLLPERRHLLVTSSLGWVDHPEGRRFVLPGDPEVPFTRPTKATGGDPAAWAEGLALLSSMGQAGYIGLAVAGLAAAAPLVRLLKKRNPIIGLAHETSKGKGSVLNYALSVWGDPDDFTVTATGTTEKGLQDKGLQLNDLPYWVDELHQLHKQEPRKAENVIYYLANGFRRTTSSQRQVAVGGERRFGVSFYASEDPIADLFQKGAQIRTIELDGAPLQTGDQAATLQGLARAHRGAIAPRLADLVRDAAPTATAEIEDVAEAYRRQHPDLRGDDAYAVALVEAGLGLLAEATGLDLPVRAAGEWLADVAATARATRPDEAYRAFHAMLNLALSARWNDWEGGEGNRAEVGGLTLAWRARGGALDINPEHPQVVAVLKPYGGGDRHAKAWANRDWIERRHEKGRDGLLVARLKVKRAGAGYVWRIPALVVEGTDQEEVVLSTLAMFPENSQ